MGEFRIVFRSGSWRIVNKHTGELVQHGFTSQAAAYDYLMDVLLDNAAAVVERK